LAGSDWCLYESIALVFKRKQGIVTCISDYSRGLDW
jgi:hypothetical protein